ncbi:hypothetical protein AO056_03514 [Aeromonas hydrophila]|nr:hypothetical protein AO056_03514 [Aeromonas hydrophila]
MVSSVIESLMQVRSPMWALTFLLLPSLVTHAPERRDRYGQSDH